MRDHKTTRRILARAALAIAVALGFAATAPADAQTRIKVGHSRITTLVPLIHAADKGYFRDAGLNVELVFIPTGPANIAALAAKEIDIGWANSVPAINARAAGVPIRLFLATEHEDRAKKQFGLFLVGTQRAGINSLADLKGKRVMINANGNACEIMVREALRTVNLKWEDIQRVVLPFPQMQAALDLGNAEAACTGDVFYNAIMTAPRINAKVLQEGIYPNATSPVLGTTFYALDPFMAANKDAILRFGKTFEKARLELRNDKEAYIAGIMKLTGFTREQAVANADESYVATPKISPPDVQTVIDAMVRAELLNAPIRAADMIETFDF